MSLSFLRIAPKVSRNCPSTPDWEPLADGRVHRLKYGKHFKGTIRAQITGARGAAEALGKAVRTQADSFEQFGYLWVQFADLSVRVGQPCRCGGTLSRLHPRHARCTACGARVIITGDLGMDLAANDAKERSEAPVQKDAQKGAQQSAQGATPSPENLQYYTDVRLFSYRQYAEMEVLAGSGKDPMGAEFLLIVSYPLSDGERVPDPRAPGAERHKVSRLPLHPFSDFIDVDALRS
jgi:hypothetical protein